MTRFKAVVFDWAGTMIDFGSFAPMEAFQEAFRQVGIAATTAEARAPMGAPKRDHIRAMLAAPRLAAEWTRVHGMPASERDIDRLYSIFLPLNEAVVARYATLVPGAAEMIADLRARGLKIGSTTGYSRAIMARIFDLAAAQGYAPDNCVCSDDLPEGRPGPLQMYQTFIDLRVYPPETVLKVDDTEPGIAEGRAAGCITVGVTLSGNHAGLTPADLAACTPAQIDALRARASAALRSAGAHHVIDTVADLPALIDALDTGHMP